ncbi:TPA: hypothetical protein HA259_08095 [Thermoplasmata archaeon]|nr:hypothetical protein [Thermoplasmata archaeon]
MFRTLGVAWVIIGLLLMVAGQNLYYDQETWPYADTGETMYYVGLALVILAIILFVLGMLLEPSMSEILKAEKLVTTSRGRLRAHREDTGADSSGSHWED